LEKRTNNGYPMSSFTEMLKLFACVMRNFLRTGLSLNFHHLEHESIRILDLRDTFLAIKSRRGVKLRERRTREVRCREGAEELD
jgi:hypothetical protein